MKPLTALTPTGAPRFRPRSTLLGPGEAIETSTIETKTVTVWVTPAETPLMVTR